MNNVIKEVSCPKCNSHSYQVISKASTKHPKYGIVIVEKRQCNECFRRYDVGSNSILEFHY